MATSTLNPRTSARSSLLALIALFALIAAACSGSTNATDQADAAAATDTTAPAADEETEDAPGDTVETDDKLAAPADDAVALPAGTSRNMTQVLAFAIEAAELESYTFTQGLAINIGQAGTPAISAAPYAFGEVANGETHVRVDLETFVSEAMGSLAGFGLGPTDLEGQQFDVWTTDGTLIMDLSQLTIAGDGVQSLADGPVSVDLASVDNVDMSAVARQFGQGSQVTDPAAMFEALKSITDAVESGTGTVGDIPITIYTATVSVADFYAAQGSSVADQLGIVESLGLAESEADAIAGLIPAVEGVALDVDIMVDDDGRVRRVASEMNMTDLVVAMFEGSAALSGEDGEPQVDLGALFGPDGLQIMLSSWQEFHDYGAAPAVVIPDATDVTDSVNELFEN